MGKLAFGSARVNTCRQGDIMAGIKITVRYGFGWNKSFNMKKSVIFCCGDRATFGGDESIVNAIIAMITEENSDEEKLDANNSNEEPVHYEIIEISEVFKCRECKTQFLTKKELERHKSSPLSRLIQKLKEKIIGAV